jgi:hypothetical protein
MGPHGVLDARVGVVSIVHGNVAVAVAHLRGCNGGGGRVTSGSRSGRSSAWMNGSAAVVLVVLVSARRRRLGGVVSGHLGVAVVSSRGAGRACGGICLPLGIHGADSCGSRVEQLRRQRQGGRRGGSRKWSTTAAGERLL